MGDSIMRAHYSWSKVLFVVATLAAAALGGFVAVRTTSTAAGEERIGPAPIATDPAHAADEKAIDAIRAGYIKAFNAGNAKALAAFWAPDGEFVDADGRTFRGRAALEKEFTTFFTSEKGLKLDVSMDSLRFVAPGVALESGTSHIRGGKEGAFPGTTYHIVHTKRDGKWFLSSVRETAGTADANAEPLNELEWLVGSWTARANGKTLETSCEWTAKRTFLIRKYTLKTVGGPTQSGIQVIGWDPILDSFRSWTFDSDGGFGSEEWTRDGKRWVLEASGVSSDGAETEATNIVTPIDHDSFTWQSVERSVNDVHLPDTAVIKVTRVKAKKEPPRVLCAKTCGIRTHKGRSP
jgi:uncharacterized protein (TIGR02246 family)